MDISDSKLKIGKSAFADCTELTSLNLGSVNMMGERTFYKCTSLVSLTLGNALTEIGEEAFRYCSGLIDVNIPDFVTKIGRYAFADCPNLETIKIGRSVDSIGDGLFFRSSLNLAEFASIESMCNIVYGSEVSHPAYCGAVIRVAGQPMDTNLIIPESVTRIGDYAFYKCDIRSVVIPESVTSIGSGAFYNTSLA